MARAALEKRVEGPGMGRGGEIGRMREGSRGSVLCMCMCFGKRGMGRCVCARVEVGWWLRWGISQITLG